MILSSRCLPQPDKPATVFFAGLDLGQAQDYTALAILEQDIRFREQPPSTNGSWPPREKHLSVRFLKRWRGVSYVAIVMQLEDIFRRPPLPGCTLAVDRSGVGVAVFDLLKHARMPVQLKGVTITGGQNANFENGCFNVPKRDLCATLQTMLQQKRLHVANLPERPVLLREMRQFRVKVSLAGVETYEALRERDHDDYVLAVATAAWVAERPRTVGSYVMVSPGPVFGNPNAGGSQFSGPAGSRFSNPGATGH